MYTMIYRSKAIPTLEPSEITTLLEKARIYNRKHGITGCLLFHNREFLQLIEGEENKVKELYGRIEKDDRHYDLYTLVGEKSKTRAFENWNMLYDNFDMTANQAEVKKKLFYQMYHQNETSVHSGRSKLVFWNQVGDMLRQELSK